MMDGIIRVAARFATIEGRTVIRIEGSSRSEPMRQIWIGYEMTAESDGIGLTRSNSRFCRSQIKASCRN